MRKVSLLLIILKNGAAKIDLSRIKVAFVKMEEFSVVLTTFFNSALKTDILGKFSEKNELLRAGESICPTGGN